MGRESTQHLGTASKDLDFHAEGSGSPGDQRGGDVVRQGNIRTSDQRPEGGSRGTRTLDALLSVRDGV